MDVFVLQLDQFLSALTLSGLSDLTTELHSRDVLTLEEKRSLESSWVSKENAKTELIALLKTKKDRTTLKALSQSLEAFKILYKQSQSHIQKERSEHLTMKDAANLIKPASKHSQLEAAILANFEDGSMSHEELADALKEASRSIDLHKIINFEGKTLLHLSCCLMTTDTVKLLVETYGFDTAVKDNDEHTPLHDACRCQKTQIVKYLLSHPSVDPNAQNLDGNTPLHIAISHSHWSIGRILLTSEKIMVPIENKNGDTALAMIDMQLASNDSKKMKKALLNHSSMKKGKKQDSTKASQVAASLADAKIKMASSKPIEVVRKKSLESDPSEIQIIPADSMVPGKKSVTVIEEVDTVGELKETPVKKNHICVSCLTGNPPVICVLLTLFVGVLLGCIIVAVAGAIILT